MRVSRIPMELWLDIAPDLAALPRAHRDYCADALSHIAWLAQLPADVIEAHALQRAAQLAE